MNKEQALEKIEELKKYIDTKAVAFEKIGAIKAFIEQEDDKSWPKEGKDAVELYGDGSTVRNRYRAGCHPGKYLLQGNLFRTREEAETERDKRIVMQKLRVLAGGYKPDWERYMSEKFSLSHNSSAVWGVTINSRLHQPGCIYFPSREAAQAAIDELGSELDCLLK